MTTEDQKCIDLLLPRIAKIASWENATMYVSPLSPDHLVVHDGYRTGLTITKKMLVEISGGGASMVAMLAESIASNAREPNRRGGNTIFVRPGLDPDAVPALYIEASQWQGMDTQAQDELINDATGPIVISSQPVGEAAEQAAENECPMSPVVPGREPGLKDLPEEERDGGVVEKTFPGGITLAQPSSSPVPRDPTAEAAAPCEPPKPYYPPEYPPRPLGSVTKFEEVMGLCEEISAHEHLTQSDREKIVFAITHLAKVICGKADSLTLTKQYLQEALAVCPKSKAVSDE